MFEVPIWQVGEPPNVNPHYWLVAPSGIVIIDDFSEGNNSGFLHRE
jgi:hypothetical protein